MDAPPPTREQVLTALSTIQDPDLGRDIVSLGMIKNLEIGGDGRVAFVFELTTPACPVRDRFESMGREPLAPNADRGKEMMRDVIGNLRKFAAGVTAFDDRIRC